MERFTGIGSGARLIRLSRKILCISALFGALLAAAVGPARAVAPVAVPARSPDLLDAGISQAGRRLVLSIETASPVPLAVLDRLPPAQSSSRFLCFRLYPLHRPGARELCLGGRRGAQRRVGVVVMNARGRAVRSETVAARVRRPSSLRLVVALPPGRAALTPHRYRWRVVENRSGCERCGASLPRSGTRMFRLRPVRAVGCTGGGAGLVTDGPRDRDVVALTFDDGPSAYTDAFADVLRDEHIDATFFEIGQEIAGREKTMRRLLREGDEIGNHTTHHQPLPGYADLATTSDLIESATHFRPCLFRPPDGAVDQAVIDAAGEAGMTTVTWDVDPGDWSNPGSDAVYSRVLDAVRPGSIVVLHDGGGNRADTLAALPRIIEALRRRGYRFATVSELLGHRLIYRPYG
jgi:peptidoglycan/xylan/chitin deacetylase (PgdA/CDA1 family)